MNRKKLLFIIIISIFIMPLFVCAKEKKEVVLKSVQLVDQSTNVTEVDSIELEDGKIKTNLIFQDIGDNITYQIKVKNNSDIHYAIDGVIDNNENPSIHYDYTYSDADFDHGAERQIFLTITYQEEIPFDSVLEDSSYHLDDSLTIQLQLYDVNAIDINDIINPATNSTALIVYIILLFTIVYFFVIKKKKILFLFLLLTISTVSFPVQAKQIIPFEISFQNQLEIPIHFIHIGWSSFAPTSGYTKLSVVKTSEIPNDAVDISEKQDGSVKAWISDDTLYWGSPYRMYTPVSSGGLFYRGVNFVEINIEDESISSLFTNYFGGMFNGLSNIQELNTSWIRTDNATSLGGMFSNCSGLKKLDLSGFVNPDIENILSLMGGCNSLEELDVSNWDNHKLKSGIFSFAGLNMQFLTVLDVTDFDTKSLTSMENMFASVGGGLETIDLSTWDFSNIVSMESMFVGSEFKTIIFGELNTINVENIDSMFTGTLNLEAVEWDSFDTSSLRSIHKLFSGSSIKSINLSVFDFSNITDISLLLSYTYSLESIEWGNADTSNVINANGLFYDSGITSVDLSNLDFSSVTKASGVFSTNSIEEIILPKVMPSSNVEMSLPNVFQNSNHQEFGTVNNTVPAKTKLSLKRYYAKFIKGESFNVKIKTLAGNSSSTYSTNNTNITSIVRSTTSPDISTMTEDNIFSISSDHPIYVWISGGIVYYYSNETIYLNENSSNMFSYLNNLSSIDFDSVNKTRTISMYHMFDSTGQNVSSLNIDLSNWDVSSVLDMSYMFYRIGYSSSSFGLNLTGWDTSNVVYMYSMFYQVGCNATTWNISGLSSFDTSSTIDMEMMFKNAGYKASTFNLNLSTWNTSKITDMYEMFRGAGYNATTWNLDLSNWDTSRVTNMKYMFSSVGYKVSIFSLDLTNWDTSNVTDMSGMFSYAGYSASTFSLGISTWNTSRVTNMYYMFDNTGHNATTWSIGDLSNWDTSNVTSMNGMFSNAGYNASTWSIGDLSGWDVSNVEGMGYMFNYAGYNATTWSIGDLSNWDTSKVTVMNYMFSNAGYYASSWNSIGTLKVYATYIPSMFEYCRYAKAKLIIYNNPSYSSAYSSIFKNASLAVGSGITVDYTEDVTNIDNIIATKSSSSNVVKGSLITE